MQTIIRPYKDSDYTMLNDWWNAAKETAPLPTMIPKESTWVLEVAGLPLLSVSVIKTNIPEYCYVENFIGNPELPGVTRRIAGKALLEHVKNYARQEGYNRLLCLGYRSGVIRRYEDLGFKKTIDAAAFVQMVGE